MDHPHRPTRRPMREETMSIAADMHQVKRQVGFISDYLVKLGPLLAQKLQFDESQLPQFDEGQPSGEHGAVEEEGEENDDNDGEADEMED